MTKTIRVRYCEGKLEPLEPLALEEGTEMTATLTRPEPPTADPWGGLTGAQRIEAEPAGHPDQAASASSMKKPPRRMGTDIIVIAEDFDAPLTPEEEELFGL